MSDEHLPPHLPRCEEDLAEWSVYADHLLTRGDPRGELLALDLSLPAIVERERVAAFQLVAKRWCTRTQSTPLAWRLGHIHTLYIAETRGPGMGVRWQAPSSGALARAKDLLASPQGRLVERLSITYDHFTDRAPWRRLLRALPASCATLELRVLPRRIRVADTTGIEELFAMMPSQVRHLELHLSSPYRNDLSLVQSALRGPFESVALRAAQHSHVALLREHAAPPRVHVDRIGEGIADLDMLAGCTLGHPGDAALVSRQQRLAFVLPQPAPIMLQDRFGWIPVRTQLARVLPEPYLLSMQWEGYATPSLVRRGETWTYKTADNAPLTVLHDGDDIADLYTLVTSDVDRRCRELLAARVA